MIAFDPSMAPRVCRICGYECGIVATGCGYIGDSGLGSGPEGFETQLRRCS